MRREKETFTEMIFLEKNVPTYCKMRTIEKETYGFWIPQIRCWFFPIEEEQERLHGMFERATDLNFDGTPVKLIREMRDVTPEDEAPIEQRPATKEEQDKLEWI